MPSSVAAPAVASASSTWTCVQLNKPHHQLLLNYLRTDRKTNSSDFILIINISATFRVQQQSTTAGETHSLQCYNLICSHLTLNTKQLQIINQSINQSIKTLLYVASKSEARDEDIGLGRVFSAKQFHQVRKEPLGRLHARCQNMALITDQDI